MHGARLLCYTDFRQLCRLSREKGSLVVTFDSLQADCVVV